MAVNTIMTHVHVSVIQQQKFSGIVCYCCYLGLLLSALYFCQSVLYLVWLKNHLDYVSKLIWIFVGLVKENSNGCQNLLGDFCFTYAFGCTVCFFFIFISFYAVNIVIFNYGIKWIIFILWWLKRIIISCSLLEYQRYTIIRISIIICVLDLLQVFMFCLTSLSCMMSRNVGGIGLVIRSLIASGGTTWLKHHFIAHLLSGKYLLMTW